MPKPINLAVLLSGGGTTLQNLLDRMDAGSLAARVSVVVSSRADAFGLERPDGAASPPLSCRQGGIRTRTLSAGALPRNSPGIPLTSL